MHTKKGKLFVKPFGFLSKTGKATINNDIGGLLSHVMGMHDYTFLILIDSPPHGTMGHARISDDTRHDDNDRCRGGRGVVMLLKMKRDKNQSLDLEGGQPVLSMVCLLFGFGGWACQNCNKSLGISTCPRLRGLANPHVNDRGLYGRIVGYVTLNQ